MGHPPERLRRFPPLSAVAGRGDDASAAGRPLRGIRGSGPRPSRTSRAMPSQGHGLPPVAAMRGFTLVELLVAIAVMALLAIAS